MVPRHICNLHVRRLAFLPAKKFEWLIHHEGWVPCPSHPPPNITLSTNFPSYHSQNNPRDSWRVPFVNVQHVLNLLSCQTWQCCNEKCLMLVQETVGEWGVFFWGERMDIPLGFEKDVPYETLRAAFLNMIILRAF